MQALKLQKLPALRNILKKLLPSILPGVQNMDWAFCGFHFAIFYNVVCSESENDTAFSFLDSRITKKTGVAVEKRAKLNRSSFVCLAV